MEEGLKMQFPPNALDDDNNDILPMAHFANELSNQVVGCDEKSVDQAANSYVNT